MIFNVITNEATGAAQALSVLGKPLPDILNALKLVGTKGISAFGDVKTAATGAGVAVKATTVATKAAAVAMNLAFGVGVGLAITGVVKLIDYIAHAEDRAEEARKKEEQELQDAIDAYKDLEDELNSLQNAYDENANKLAELYELRSNQTITKAEEAYLTQLEGQNEKLRQQIEYQRTLADIEAKKLEKTAVEKLQQKDAEGTSETKYTSDGVYSEYTKVTNAEKIKQNTANITSHLFDLNSYEKVIQGQSLSQAEREKYEKQISTWQSFIDANTGTSSAAEANRQVYQAQIDRVQKLLNGTLSVEDYNTFVASTTEKVEALIQENDELLNVVEPLNDAIVSTTGANYELKKSNDEIIDGARQAVVEFGEYKDFVNGTAVTEPTREDNSFQLLDADVKKLQEYQSKIEKLAATLSNVQNLSASDLTSFLSEFHAYANVFEDFGVNEFGEGDIEGAIQTIAQRIKAAAANEVPQMSSYIEAMFTEAFDLHQALYNVNAQIDELEAILARIKSGEVFSQTEISDIKTKFNITPEVEITPKGYKLDQSQIESLLNDSVSEYNDYLLRLDDLNIYSRFSLKELSGDEDDILDELLDKFDKQIELLDARKQHLDNLITMTENAGKLVSSDVYQDLIAVEKDIQTSLLDERAALVSQLETAMANGSIAEYDDEWYELTNAINEVTLAIDDSAIQLVEYENLIRQLEWDNFDRLLDLIHDIVEESEFLIDLMSHEELMDEAGSFTEAGLATLAQHLINRETYLNKAKDYESQLAALDEEYEGRTDNTTYLEEKERLIGLQRDSILAAQDETQAMVELAQEGIQAQIDATQELIDKKKEALEQEQELYEYQKNIKDKSKNVADLQKQLRVYEQDNSEEGKQKAQQLRNQLKEAEQDLEETQYDKWKQDQTDMLDELMEEYTRLQDELSKDTAQLFADAQDAVRDNANVIDSKLQSIADQLGITVSDDMQLLWGTLSDLGAAVGGESDASMQKTLSTIKSKFADLIEDMTEYYDDILEYLGKKKKDEEKETEDGDKTTNPPPATSTTTTTTTPDSTVTDTMTGEDVVVTGNGLKLLSFPEWKKKFEAICADDVWDTLSYATSGLSGLINKTTYTSTTPSIMREVGDIVVNVGDVVTQDAEGLVDNIANALQNNKRIQGIVQCLTADQIIGNPSFNVLLH